MIMPYRWIALVAFALAGCQEDGSVSLAACGADQLQDLVDKAPDMMGMVELPASTRILGPDDAATTDLVPERLNVSFDAEGIVTRVWCG